MSCIKKWTLIQYLFHVVIVVFEEEKMKILIRGDTLWIFIGISYVRLDYAIIVDLSKFNSQGEWTVCIST